MLRKRVKKFSRIGILKHWLEMHIFLCSVGPIFVLFHTAFKFGGIVAVSFWSMVAVVLSGVIGRFIYIQIPRTIQGREIDLFELNEENIDLTLKLRENLKVDEKIIQKIEEFLLSVNYGKVSLKNILWILLKDYVSNYFALRLIKKELKKTNFSKIKRKQVLNIAKSKFVLARRIGLLKLMQELFKYWHVAHLPFAIIMLVIMVIHVGVTIVFGYKWIF